MRPAFALAVAVLWPLLTAGSCVSTPREPIIKTVTVSVPVAVPCRPDLGQAPSYPDTGKALKDAPDLFERVKLLLAGRELRITQEAALRGALKACGAEK